MLGRLTTLTPLLHTTLPQPAAHSRDGSNLCATQGVGVGGEGGGVVNCDMSQKIQ